MTRRWVNTYKMNKALMKLNKKKVKRDVFLEGKKIYLRPLSTQDLEIWYQWFNDPKITALMNKGHFPNTKATQEEYLKSLSKSKNDLQLGIVFKEDQPLIGIIGIHQIDWVHRRGDVSVVIGERRYWGQDIATEAIHLIAEHAFSKLNLNKLTAGMSSENPTSKRSFEKNGFVVEGKTREQFFYQGKYVDGFVLGLLEEDWRNDKR